MKTKLDQQQKPVWLTGGAVIDGQYYAPGEPTPYASESEVPENLRHLIARDESEIPSKPIRNIYDQQPGPEPGEAGIYYQATGSGQWRRQAVRAARGLEEQAWCEAQAEADQQLPAETQEALQDQHDRRIALLKAQGEYAQRLTDATYEAATQEAESRTVVFHVKRGSIFVRCAKTKCKPGEAAFTKDESGEWVFAGTVDSNGEPPTQPIIT
jgi:hypothetical protein